MPMPVITVGSNSIYVCVLPLSWLAFDRWSIRESELDSGIGGYELEEPQPKETWRVVHWDIVGALHQWIKIMGFVIVLARDSVKYWHDI